MVNEMHGEKIQPVDIYYLKQKNKMPHKLYKKALGLAGFPVKADNWKDFLNVILLFIGSALFLSGVVFFFAYNWASMHKFFKLGIIEAGIIIPVISALYYGYDSLTGKVLFLSSAIFIGAFLAVYGQIYQTGADSYELFRAWSLLILLPAVLLRFTPLIMVLIIVANLSVIFYWNQMVDPMGYKDATVLFNITGYGNFAILAVLEFVYFQKQSWLQNRWIHKVMALIIQSVVTIRIVIFIASDNVKASGVQVFLAVLLFIGMLVWFAYFNIRKNYDIFIITTAMASIITVITATFIKAMIEGDVGSGSLFVIAILIIAQIAGAAFILKNIHQRFRGQL